VGNRVRFSVRLLVRKGGGRSLCDPDPDKSFKINRVPVKANNCSGLVSRIKKPATCAGNSVWRVSRRLCHASETRGATRCCNLWGWLHHHPNRVMNSFNMSIAFLNSLIAAIIGWAF